ncbi:hypothetical protein C8J57DRAFT_1716977 [Mycena rebaudengoi]|nr:hypothetical protein C8J57DRAFT_1716977 [Mycena rebaudengoi]
MDRYPLFPNTLFLTYFTSVFIFHLAPGVLRRYPHPYTFALANASAWAGDKIQQGLTSLTFFIAFATACHLSVSAYLWIAGTSAPTTASTPTSVELEDGLAVLEAEVEAAPPAASPSLASGISEAHAWTRTLLMLMLFLFSASVFVLLLLFVHHGIVSRQNSVLNNIGALAVWILRGWEVVFFYGLFAALVAYVQKKRRSAAATREAERTEVPFEGWMLEEQDTPAPPERTNEMAHTHKFDARHIRLRRRT